MGLQFSFCLLFNVHYPYQYYILFQYIRSQAVVIFLCFVIMCTPLASSSTSCPRKGSSGMILPVMIIIQYYGYLARAGGIGKCRIGGWNILLPNNTLLIYFIKSKRIVCASLLPLLCQIKAGNEAHTLVAPSSNANTLKYTILIILELCR